MIKQLNKMKSWTEIVSESNEAMNTSKIKQMIIKDFVKGNMSTFKVLSEGDTTNVDPLNLVSLWGSNKIWDYKDLYSFIIGGVGKLQQYLNDEVFKYFEKNVLFNVTDSSIMFNMQKMYNKPWREVVSEISYRGVKLYENKELKKTK